MINKNEPIHLSIVVPVFRCAPCLSPLMERLEKSVSPITKDWEVIFVDDRSDDNSWEILQRLHQANQNVVLLQLSRNFGQHAAITAGLAHTRGDWVVVMDCDLQDPPEEIAKLYEKVMEGFDIVYSRRVDKEMTPFRKVAPFFYAKFLNLFSETHFSPQNGNFSIISRPVVNSFLALKDHERHYLHVLYWLGYRSAEITYKHAQRFAGKSSYDLKSLLRHAFNGVFFQTTIFLKMVIYFGFLIAGSSILLILYLFYHYFKIGAAPGWTSLAALILFVGGVTIISVGVCGLYIGRIFNQVKGRPIYVVSNKMLKQ